MLYLSKNSYLSIFVNPGPGDLYSCHIWRKLLSAILQMPSLKQAICLQINLKSLISILIKYSVNVRYFLIFVQFLLF